MKKANNACSMRSKKCFFPTIIAVLLTLALSFLPTYATCVRFLDISRSNPVSLELLGQINLENILTHVGVLSRLGSRVSGYEGFYKAAEYIRNYWSSLGYETFTEPFSVTVPVSEGSSIIVQTPEGSLIEMEAYPLWPNHVNPSPYKSPEEGDKLIYVSIGVPEDFNGVDPAGKFVLMDFNNRWYWKNAALFGAKGVIFLEPEDTSCVEALQKSFSVPVNFPRLYIGGRDSSLLRDLISKHGELRIWVNSKMVWEQKNVENIIAVVEGTDPALKNEVAIISAYYDSWSIVPQVSPGATDSLGIAFLLEVSRLLKENPPKRTVWLVAFAGHYQSLAGAREFVEGHFSDLGSKIKMMISLDLASDSDFVAVYASGSTYGYNYPSTFLSRYDKWIKRIFNEWLPALENELDREIHLIDGVLWSYPSWIRGSPPFEPFLRCFEAEVFVEACYGGGLGFITTNAFRIRQLTPLDTFDKINYENLYNQVTFLWPILYYSVNMVIDYFLAPSRLASDWGLVTVTLQLAQYNKTTDWFDPFSHRDAVFFISVSGTTSPAGTIVAAGFRPAAGVGTLRSTVVQGVMAGLFAAPPIASPGQVAQAGLLGTPLGFTFIVKPDSEGKVVLKGIKPYTGIDVQAYIIDPDTGRILYATDTGPFGTGKVKYGGLFGQASALAAPAITPTAAGLGYLAQSGEIARAFSVYITHGFRYVPVFECASIAILGLLDVSNIQDPSALSVEVYNFISHSWHVWRDTLAPWPEAMVFVKPDTLSEIIVRSQSGILAVLNNASENYPEGRGYRARHGETVILTLFDASRDMFYLAHGRAGLLMSKMSANPRLFLYLDKMYEFRKLAEEALRSGNRGEFYSYSIACWQYALEAYGSSFVLIYDTVNTASFFFFLSVMFVILLSRLITRRWVGIKGTLIVFALFLIVNLALAAVHPGYVISTNVWMVIIGLSIILFSFLLLYVVVNEFNSTIKSISESILGLHRTDIERGSLIFASLSMGLENLKKRPLRSSLALATVIITVCAMTLFTTMGVMVYMYSASLGSPPYTGILIKRSFPDVMERPISEIYLLGIRNIVSKGVYNVQVNPRAWIYPPGQKMLIAWNPKYSTIRGILAISGEEMERLSAALLPGGIPSIPNATTTMLVGREVANALSKDLNVEIKPGTQIRLYGIPLTVTGILDDEMGYAILSKDLDQSAITPPDPTVAALARTPTFLSLSNLIIIPFELAKEYFNAQPNVISLVISSSSLREDDLWKTSLEMSLILHFDVFYGFENNDSSRKVGGRDIYSLGGVENMIVPLLLSSFTLLSVMLSSVYERVREIATLSTIGLSPRHIGAIFIMESVVLAFMGSFLGYIIGAGTTYIIWNLGLYPEGLLPNVSSGVLIIVIGIIILATVLSSIYPVTKASRLATPSLLRKWRIESRPVGNQWSVSFPFNATLEENIGVLAFLSEFLETSSSERTGLFMLLKPIELVDKDERKILVTRLQLSPFDAGIIQDIGIVSRKVAPDRYSFEVHIERVSGVEGLWIASNRALFNELRKQFLLWRALSPEKKSEYIKRGLKRWGEIGFEGERGD